jgi:hypothetical protein
MTGVKETPVKNPTLVPPAGCSKCKTGFRPEGWARSKWTRSGYSPWCPQCHADLAHDSGAFRIKPGPKPKGRKAANGGWTNLPIN